MITVKFYTLLFSIMMVESHGNENAIGDNGAALGCMQIHMCVIDDVNRIYKTNYRSQDRLVTKKSFMIAKKYLKYWGDQYEKDTGKKPNAEIYARIWNGGPIGYKKTATESYWEKVRKEILINSLSDDA